MVSRRAYGILALANNAQYFTKKIDAFVFNNQK